MRAYTADKGLLVGVPVCLRTRKDGAANEYGVGRNKAGAIYLVAYLSRKIKCKVQQT